MKNNPINFKIAAFLGAATILAIFITRPALSQETAKKESHKKIVMKIVSDDNGKTTVTDTTFEINDTAMIDSLNREVEKVIVLGKGGKHGCCRIQNMPKGFSYNFEMPCNPEWLKDLDELGELELEGIDPGPDMVDFTWEQRAPELQHRVLRYDRQGGGQTLTDILGDIPMDRVVSYSIKDRKNGKRIIIDLNDAPMFERQERVVVIREPGRAHRNMDRGDRQVKVIVNTEDNEEAVPPPPPPPPPAKPKTK
jgi:hypothetical protein